ncbi:Cell division coordinator CpoB [subsurface metagenome]
MKKKICPVGIMIALLSFLFLFPPLAAGEDTSKQYIFAQRLFEEEKFSLAALQFEKFLDTFPGNPNCDKAQYGMGMSFWHLDDYKRAASGIMEIVDRRL